MTNKEKGEAESWWGDYSGDIEVQDTNGNKIVVVPKSAYAELKAQNEKLKALILLADPAVSDVEVNTLSIRQWSEFIKHFPQ